MLHSVAYRGFVTQLIHNPMAHAMGESLPPRLGLEFLATIVATCCSLGRKPEEYLIEVKKVLKGRHETHKCGNMSSLQDLGIAEQTIRRLTPAATTCRPVGTKVSAIGLTPNGTYFRFSEAGGRQIIAGGVTHRTRQRSQTRPEADT